MRFYKTLFSSIKQRGHWLFLLICTNCMLLFFTWLLHPGMFRQVSCLAFLFILLILSTGLIIDQRKKHKQVQALHEFTENPCEKTLRALELVCHPSFYPDIQLLSQTLSEQDAQIKAARLELLTYREMIETWAHEIKTPLSLTTLVLANHREEMSPYVLRRMEHIRHSISLDVEKILYYARLQIDHPDYKLEHLCLPDIVQEALSDYAPMIEEKQVQLQMQLSPLEIVSDRHVLLFLLSQLLSNAFKYMPEQNGNLSIDCHQESAPDSPIHLQIRDNGCGVQPQDAPFLFDKGFTGSHPLHQDATGIGLYLVKKYADALSISVSLIPGLAAEHATGFGIELIFPHVDK